MGTYKPGDKITRRMAWNDLIDDFKRYWDAFKSISHTFTDMWVNFVRIAGIQDRDRSQLVGRTLMSFFLLIFIIYTIDTFAT